MEADRAEVRPSRRLDWPDCQNVRDLGGLPRPGGVTRSGVWIRSDTVTHLNAAGLEAMRAYGVTTVVDLRSSAEIAVTPSPFADGSVARYVHSQLIDDANLNDIGDSKSMLERYLFIVDNRPQAFRDVFTTLAETDGAVLFHCFAGKDRTGLVAAMLLSLAGVSLDDIATDYCETDVQLAKQYDIWTAEAPPEKREAYRVELQCPPERIRGVLDHVEMRWGGVAGYLEESGVAPGAIDRLSSKLA